MATSAQITKRIQESADPRKMKQAVYEVTRYFVAQKPAAEDYSETTTGYWQGRMVVPGPKANPKYGMLKDIDNMEIIENKHYIRFTDSATTDGADVSVGQALYTSMTPDEADAYEAVLEKEWKQATGGTEGADITI